MFQYILGIIIDQNGYYLSFGKYTEKFANDYFSLHGRSFLVALLASNWVNTHKDLSWNKKDIQKILKADSLGCNDFDLYAFQDFEKLSHLGYAILLNANYIGSNPVVYGYLPKELTYPQVMTLLNLRSDILYSPYIESDFSIHGTEQLNFSIYEWYQELEQKGMQRVKLNQKDEL